MTTDQIIEEALALPPSDRLKIAEELLKSTAAEASVSADVAWDGEIARRIQDFENGTARTITHDELRDRFHVKLAKARDAESSTA